MEKTQTYEAMFLLDAGKGHEQNAEPIQRLLDRAGAEVLAIKPWEERRLAYEIEGRKRGLYMLSYFQLDPAKVNELEHDSLLADDILRVLILRKDDLTDEDLNAETPAMLGPVEGDGETDDADNDDKSADNSDDDSDSKNDSDDGDSSEDDSDNDADDSDDSDDEDDK